MMKPDIAQALERMADRTQRGWHLERCAQSPVLKAQLVDVAHELGIELLARPSRGVRRTATVQHPFVDLDFSSVKFEFGEFRASYGAGLTVSLLANVYWVTYIIEIDNASPREVRVETDLRTGSGQTVLKSWAVLDAPLDQRLGGLGLRRASRDELFAYVPELEYTPEGHWVRDAPSVMAALVIDVFGPDGEVAPVLAERVGRLRSLIESVYTNTEKRLALQSQRPPCEAGLEQLFAEHLDASAVTRTSPELYPSTSWTLDFGEIHNGSFHARFLTDIYVSKLAPHWHFWDRFVVADPNPDATQPELTDGRQFDYGYTVKQTEVVAAISKWLAERGITLIDDRLLDRYVPSPKPTDRYQMIEHLLFGLRP